MLGKWGLKVTGHKEFLVVPHIIYIYCRNVLLFGGLIKLYLHITSGDVSNLIT